MVGWHHRLNGHRCGWTLGVGDGQGDLIWCGSWGHKELDTTKWLNWTVHLHLSSVLSSGLASFSSRLSHVVTQTALAASGQFSSVQFSCSVMSNSLWPLGLQHTRLPCASPSPGAYSNSCPSSPWCHPIISSSAVCFSSRLQYFPASGSFQMSQHFSSGGQMLKFQLQHQFFQWLFTTDFFRMD